MSLARARWRLAALVAIALSSPAQVVRADEPASRPAGAEAIACDPVRTAYLDRVLAGEARNAARWRWAWAAVFGAAAAGQLVIAGSDLVPDDERRDARRMSLYLGAGKATIGLGARLVIPPRVARPRLTGDACADERAIKAALALTARRERSSMALNVLGGLALNVGTSLWLGLREDSWTDAGISFGMGTAVSLVSAFTQPRRVWRRAGVHADGPLVTGTLVAPWSAGGAHGLAVTGTF